MLICIFCFFQLGIFVNVKAFYDYTVFSDTFTSKRKLLSVLISKTSISLKIEDTILNPGLAHLYISSLMVST